MAPPTLKAGLGLLLLAPLLYASAACSSPAPVRAQRPWQSLDVQVGMRSYDDLEPVEDQTTLGLEYVYERPGDAFGWGIGVSWGQQDGSESDGGATTDVEADVYELTLGLRRSCDLSSSVRPYVGLGLSLTRVDATFTDAGGSSSDDDLGTGWFVRGGVLYDVSEALHVGLDARAAFWTDLDVEGTGWDTDHQQLALVVGYSF